MAMDRWNPFRDVLALREAMDRMFDDGYVRSAASPGRASTFPVDLAETDQGFLLKATLPGIRPEDVQITIHGDTLTIRGQTVQQEERPERNWIIREQRAGAFHRMLTLPAPVESEQATAEFKDGILELVLPKAEKARPRQIKVSAGPSTPGTPGTAGAPAGGREGERDTEPPTPPPDPAVPQVPAATQGPTVTQGGDPTTPAGKDPVTQSSEESMDASDPPSWTRERS